jgi:hypothetical protein
MEKQAQQLNQKEMEMEKEYGNRDNPSAQALSYITANAYPQSRLDFQSVESQRRKKKEPKESKAENDARRARELLSTRDDSLYIGSVGARDDSSVTVESAYRLNLKTLKQKKDLEKSRGKQ